MQSFPTPLDAVSQDIEKVGGENAYLGQTRDIDGKKYVLVRASNMTLTSNLILGLDGGESFTVELAAGGGRCNGIRATTKQVGLNDYFWMQTYGRFNGLIAPSATQGSYICCLANGVGETVVIEPTILSAITMRGCIGWAITNEAANVIDVFINPGFIPTL